MWLDRCFDLKLYLRFSLVNSEEQLEDVGSHLVFRRLAEVRTLNDAQESCDEFGIRAQVVSYEKSIIKYTVIVERKVVRQLVQTDPNFPELGRVAKFLCLVFNIEADPVAEQFKSVHIGNELALASKVLCSNES